MSELDRQREPLTVQVNTEYSGDFMGFKKSLDRDATDADIDKLCDELAVFLKQKS